MRKKVLSIKRFCTHALTSKISSLLLFPMFLLFALPSSTTYKLNSFGFGSGGTDSSASTTYTMEGISGEVSGDVNSTTYGANSGLIFLQQSHIPSAPTFVNSSSWYNKLKITINKDPADPTDTTYAIAISDDNWVTTEWVQNDNTVGATLGIEDHQTYTNWGGASGEFIIGLTANTTYKVKVKSRNGNYTESPLGPEASATTSQVSISFDIDISPTDTETAAPYAINFGDLTSGSVSTATDKIWLDLTTNAELGAYVYIRSTNAGLKSTVLNYTISSTTGDLSVLSEGFGLRVNTSTESSGGPLLELSPYNGASDNIGTVDTTNRELFSTSDSPITSGRGSILVKSKSSATTPAADDYTDVLTMIVSATF